MFDPLRVGRSVRAIRIRLGLRQRDVAKRAGVSRAFVSSLERGQARAAAIDKIEAVCRVLGADLDIRVRWRGEGLDRLLDEGHATLVDLVVSVLGTAGWEVALEVTFNQYGDRGAIDVLGWHPAGRSLLIVEVKSTIPDAQATLAPLDRKARLGPKVARDRGWDPATVSRLLVVTESPTNRRRVERFGELFAAALPARNREVRRWLHAPRGAISGLLFFSNVNEASTRRSTAGRIRVRPPRTASPLLK